MNEKDLTSTSVSSEISLALVVSALFFGFISFKTEFNRHLAGIDREKKIQEETMQKLKVDHAETYVAKNPVSKWKIYENRKYGFQIKYPQDWLPAREQKPENSTDDYLLKISFRNNEGNPEKNDFRALLAKGKIENEKTTKNLLFRPGLKDKMSDNGTARSDAEPDGLTKPAEPQKGFDIYVYKNEPKNTSATRNKSQPGKIDPDDFLKNISPENIGSKIIQACSSEKTSIIRTDFYFDKNPYHSLVGEKYSFNIIPLEEENTGLAELIPLDSDRATESFEFIPLEPEEPKPSAAKPRPLVFKISCPKENDHPRYSKTKGRHMDEDCCPDPDEWPKPGCIYSPKGYSIMLPGPPAKLAKSKK